MSPSQPDPLSQASVTLILLSLACIGLYVVLVNHDRTQLEESVRGERRHRREAEIDAKKAREQLDGALATIHRLNPESDDPEPADTPAG
jgi:hypothetical protein